MLLVPHIVEDVPERELDATTVNAAARLRWNQNFLIFFQLLNKVKAKHDGQVNSIMVQLPKVKGLKSVKYY